jgi:DNA primase large subunit
MGSELGLPTVQAPQGAATGPTKAPWEVDPRALPDRGEMEPKELWLPFTSFLPARRNISGASWNLVNLGVVNGRLRLNRDQYTRLLQEKVRERVEEGLDMKVRPPKLESLDGMIVRLKAKVDGRKKDYSPTEMGKLTITRLPPCMRQVLGMSQSGENLPHHARFALVTFLHTVGMSSEEIFKVFMNAPDFKGDIVRYQIEHITGESSATSYMVPNCDTMKTGGICYNPDGLCEKEWMTNPMIYYRVKGKKMAAKREDSAS